MKYNQWFDVWLLGEGNFHLQDFDLSSQNEALNVIAQDQLLHGLFLSRPRLAHLGVACSPHPDPGRKEDVVWDRTDLDRQHGSDPSTTVHSGPNSSQDWQKMLFLSFIRTSRLRRQHPQTSPHGSVVERVTSNDKVVSSILAVGNKSKTQHLLCVAFSCIFALVVTR